jgi:hypothetical protein
MQFSQALRGGKTSVFAGPALGFRTAMVTALAGELLNGKDEPKAK